MSVLDRSALSDSPLADLHAIASELSIDGYRRLRRDELIDAILDKQQGVAADSGEDAEEKPRPRRRSRARSTSADAEAEADTASAAAEAEADPDATASSDETETADADDDGEEEAAPRPRRTRTRSRSSAAKPAEAETEDTSDAAEPDEDEAPTRSSRSRGSRGRGRSAAAEAESAEPPADNGDELVEGVVELLPGGSGFLRVAGPEPSDDDVYISSAQVKRCELVTGDRVAGPKRSPRRSERFASLVRIETINGRPAAELADSVRFDDLPATFPSTLIALGSEDPTLKAIETLTPFGRGSRVTITGPSRAGKTETLRLIAGALATQEEITVTVALAGVRPEELGEWTSEEEGAPPAPSAALSLAASEDASVAAIEPVVDQARRLAARGSHAVVLIDTLDGLSAPAARKLMASARCLTQGGSVTIVATAAAPVGGETTVIALDLEKTSTARFPAIDLIASGTLRPEALIGVTAARKIVRERVKAAKD